MTPADTFRCVSKRFSVFILIFRIIRLHAVIATHSLPSGILDDIVQLAVHKQTATFLCSPAATERHTPVTDTTCLRHYTVVEQETQPYLSTVRCRRVNADILWCRDIAWCDTIQRATLKPTGTTCIDIVDSTLYDTLLIIAASPFLRTMGILITCYLTMVECGTVSIHMQGECLTSSLTTRILDTQVLCVEIRGKDSQCRIVTYILTAADGLLAIGSSDDGPVHPLAYQGYLFRRGPLTGSYLHHSLIGSCLDLNDSLLTFHDSINCRLYRGIVPTAVFGNCYCLLCESAHCHHTQHQSHNLLFHLVLVLVVSVWVQRYRFSHRLPNIQTTKKRNCC